MISLTDFIAALPGVRPKKARALILEGPLLTSDEKADFYKRSTRFYVPVIEIGPDAAKAVLAAYKRGRLPMQVGEVPRDAPVAAKYVAGRRKLTAERDERRRRAAAMTDASVVVESDFYDEVFLDKVFHAHFGQGSGSLILAGISVSKSLTCYPSNSGKTQGWAVAFSWVGSDGIARGSGRLPAEASNRRNDAARNWGLPE